ncbi:unnamed protein product [Bursaphelenchus okinawaensis]|uniref:Fungal lipase-type domain-containing protein n=1 Tax=Bursaphelenchus okinawaensis TaxID=465554 RepID=A0A811KX47_9BILA|nr:unnamed protein product [Bursaphelenchus okinawaensis]CAG9113141.1 unnamed protein product [Bursaphelenchus okinawaensis]
MVIITLRSLVKVPALLVLFTTFSTVFGQFNDSLAKNKFLPLAAAAYTIYPAQCVTNVFEDASVTKTVTAECGTNIGEFKLCYGFTGVAHKDKAVFLSYRGTVGGIQLLYESYETAFAPMVEAKIGGKVSQYFYNVYSNLQKDGLNDEVLRLAKEYPDYAIWIGGHSLGGALSSISAAELIKIQNISPEKVTVITFGEPRSGNSEYSKNYDALVPKTFRVVNKADLVPHLPPLGFFDYVHHSTEVWYEKGMLNTAEYTMCPPESNDCSNKIGAKYIFTDHFTYYMQFVVGYGLSGCGAIAAAFKKFFG